MSLHWVALAGQVAMHDGKFFYTPDAAFHPGPPDAVTVSGIPFQPYATIRANLDFAAGEICLRFRIDDPRALLQLVLSTARGFSIYCGINVLGARYGFATYRNDEWQLLEGTGYGSTIQADTWHELRLLVHGSNLVLQIDGVAVSSVQQQLEKAPISLYFQSVQGIEVSDFQVKAKHPVCFVVMQFSEEFNTLYREVIEPTCRAHGYETLRADEFYNSGMIIDDITQSIRDASVIIADVTPDNANVFYEVGYAHGIGKPTILLSDRKREKLPFDISGFRTLFYNNTIGGKRAVEDGLNKHLANFAAKHLQVPRAPASA